MVDYFLETYAINDVITEADAKIMSCTTTLNNTPIEYAKILWAKALRYDQMYDKHVKKVASLKAYKTPFARACVRFEFGTSMQPYKKLRDMSHP